LIEIPLQTHAEFFSEELKLPATVDPQVFVAQVNAPSVVGLQGIKRLAGLRNASPADAASIPLFTAHGARLSLTVHEWFSATGKVILIPQTDGRERIIVQMSGLKPGGVYSLFENHFDRDPVGFSPLDGFGTDNSFVADSDGNATVTVMAPAVLNHANAILVVFHSDGATHGASRGEIGVNAHHQLIARLP